MTLLAVEDVISIVVDVLSDVEVGLEEPLSHESSRENKLLNDCYSFDLDDAVEDEKGNKNSFGLTFY